MLRNTLGFVKSNFSAHWLPQPKFTRFCFTCCGKWAFPTECNAGMVTVSLRTEITERVIMALALFT